MMRWSSPDYDPILLQEQNTKQETIRTKYSMRRQPLLELLEDNYIRYILA